MYEFTIVPVTVVPLQNYDIAFQTYNHFVNLPQSSLPIKFNVNRNGFIESIENIREIIKSSPDFNEKMSRFQFDYELNRMEAEVKRLWSCLVSKWVGLKKSDDIIIKNRYRIDKSD